MSAAHESWFGVEGSFGIEHVSVSPEETARIAEALGRALAAQPPAARSAMERGVAARVLAMRGDLGTGKTTFTKGLALGLGVSPDERITSPTFVLRHEHRGALRLIHYDVYRLGGAAELRAIGFEEDVGSPDAVVVVEWADRVEEALPPEALQMELFHVASGASEVAGDRSVDSARRALRFRGPAALWEGLVRRALEGW